MCPDEVALHVIVFAIRISPKREGLVADGGISWGPVRVRARFGAPVYTGASGCLDPPESPVLVSLLPWPWLRLLGRLLSRPPSFLRRLVVASSSVPSPRLA